MTVSNNAHKIAIVTGGSSGIGLCAARALRDKGCKVYIICRRDYDEKGLILCKGDITNEARMQEIISSIYESEGRIDIVVNCAGMGISGAIEFTALADAQRQFDVNFFGMVNVNHAVVPIMRKAGSGRIINISSMAAPIPIPFQAFYSASKAAVNNYSCALANELRPYGVTVSAVQPGDISTGFTDARDKSFEGDDEYGGRISKSAASMEKDERGGMKPEIVGNFVAKAALKKNIAPVYSVGLMYKFFAVVMRVLPWRMTNWLVGKIYTC